MVEEAVSKIVGWGFESLLGHQNNIRFQDHIQISNTCIADMPNIMCGYEVQALVYPVLHGII